MPTSIITLRYRKSDNSASYVEVNDLYGWLNGSTLALDWENANKLLLKILYWKLNSTNGNRGFGDSDAYVIGFDDKEHRLDAISIDYDFIVNPSPRAYVHELTENKLDCSFNGC